MLREFIRFRERMKTKMSFKDKRMDIMKLRFFYKRAFLIYALILATELSRVKGFDFVTIIMMMWGIGLLVYDVYDSKGKCLFKNVVLLSFMILGIMTCVLNISHVENFIITAIQLFVLYSFDMRNRFSNIKKEINKINFAFIIATFGLTLFGIIFYKFNLDLFPFSMTDYSRGEFFKGFYIISRTAAMASYVSVVLSVMCITTMKRVGIYKRIASFYIVNILIQGYAMLHTGSIGVWVSSLLFMVIAFMMMIPNKIVRRVISALVAIGIIMGGIATRNSEYLKERQAIWESGIVSVFSEHPIIGAGPSNVPTIIENSLKEDLGSLKYRRTENSYLDVLYSNGIMGFVTFMCFLMNAMWMLYRRAFNNVMSEKDLIYVKLIFAFLASILIISFVESTIIYSVNLIAAVFWIYMSYGAFVVKKYRE